MADMDLARGLEVLRLRTRRVQFVLTGYLALTAAFVICAAATLGGAVDIEDSSMASGIVALVYLLFVASLIASIVIVAMWIHRAHANLRLAGVDGLEFSPTWAFGWFFIPIANLFKPFQAMRELWNAAHGSSDGFAQPVDRRLSAWWGFWIAGNIVCNVGSRFKPDTGANIGIADVIGFGLLGVAAWLLLQIVGEIDAAERGGMGLSATFA